MSKVLLIHDSMFSKSEFTSEEFLSLECEKKNLLSTLTAEIREDLKYYFHVISKVKVNLVQKLILEITIIQKRKDNKVEDISDLLDFISYGTP